MSQTTTRLRVLGLAEELVDADPFLGDDRLQQALRSVLDRLADAMVDVARGEPTASVRTAPQGSAAEPPASETTTGGALPDRASCSALAARCHSAATLLAAPPDLSDAGPPPAASSALARAVADGLRSTAAGLQRYVQDLQDDDPPAARQRLHRALRRAVAGLPDSAP